VQNLPGQKISGAAGGAGPAARAVYPGRRAPMPEERPRVACTAIVRAAAASSKLM